MNKDLRLADAGAAGSFGGWVLTHVLEAAPLIQELAGLAALCAGIASARYYWKKANEIDKD